MISMQRLLAMCLLGAVCSVREEGLASGPLHTAVFNEHVGAIAPLVAEGEPVNELQEGVTPLGMACKTGNPGLVEALLENNADPNMKTGPHRKKELPLGIAAYADNYNIGVVRALLSAKANAGAVDDYGKSALAYAQERQRTAIAQEITKAQ